MSIRRITNEHLLYFLALALAGFFRFYRLGAAPLSDFEARWALQALQVAGQPLAGVNLALGPQPAYGLLTGALFGLFGSGSFLARFLPALAGTLLVLAPWFFRRQLGRPAALILAFGLALDPGLVTISRLAGGPLMGLGFGLLALALWSSGRPILAGLSGGVAALSGPQVLNGIFALVVAWLALFVLTGVPSRQPESHRTRQAIYTLGTTILLLGTLFFWAPQGLAALADSLMTYLSGWVEPSGESVLKLLATLVFFGLFPLIFAIPSAIRILRPGRAAGGERAGAFLLLWAAAALLVEILYPARQAASLAWVLVPLWGLAALEIARHLPHEKISPLAAAQAALVVVLLSLFWFTLAGLARALPGAPGSQLRLGIMAGLLALILLTSLLIALGWSWEIGRQGLVWGLVAGLGLWSLSTLWGAAQLRQNSPLELIAPPPGPGQERLLLATLHDLSSWNTGLTQAIEIQTNLDSPALLWALRGFKNLTVNQGAFQGNLEGTSLSPVLITSQLESAPALSGSYRGQDFVWWVYPGWNDTLPSNLAAWVASREAPLTTEKIILWARSDLFPGAGDHP